MGNKHWFHEAPDLEIEKHLERLRQEKINAMGVSSELLGVQDKRVKGTDFPEVMNIFNELLGAWAANSKTLVGLHPGSQIEWALEINEIDKKKEVYERRFKEALGVE